MNDVTVQLEDWLNAALGDGNFGTGLDQFTFFVVSAFDESEENERWAAPHNKLGSFKSLVSGESVRTLSIAVTVSPADLMALSLEGAMRLIGSALRVRVETRPKRVPKGFEFDRCAAAISSALSRYVTV